MPRPFDFHHSNVKKVGEKQSEECRHVLKSIENDGMEKPRKQEIDDAVFFLRDDGKP